MKRKVKRFFQKWREVFKEHKILFFVDLFFIVGVLVVAVSQFFNENYYDVFLDSVSSILLNPEGTNDAVTVKVSEMVLNGGEYTFGGYIDIGLIDTMKDLFVDFFGALLSGIIGYFYAKDESKNRIFGELMPRVKDKFHKRKGKFE